MTERQKCFLVLLKSYTSNGDWVSPTKLGGLYSKGAHSSLASPVLKKLVELGYAERNAKGHYRITKKGVKEYENWYIVDILEIRLRLFTEHIN
jgi:predicted transcriptional regulator